MFEAHPDATHFRYPYVYGPRQLVPREWCIVRRVLDGRERIIVADEGLTLHHHALHRELRARAAARGRPARRGGRPDLQRRRRRGAHDPPGHRPRRGRARPPVRDRVDALRSRRAGPPAADAAAADPPRARPHAPSAPGSGTATRCRPARPWPARRGGSADNPHERGGTEEKILTDPFDYAAEDQLIDVVAGGRAVGRGARRSRPSRGYGLAYSGPGGRPRTQEVFEP